MAEETDAETWYMLHLYLLHSWLVSVLLLFVAAVLKSDFSSARAATFGFHYLVLGASLTLVPVAGKLFVAPVHDSVPADRVLVPLACLIYLLAALPYVTFTALASFFVAASLAATFSFQREIVAGFTGGSDPDFLVARVQAFNFVSVSCRVMHDFLNGTHSYSNVHSRFW